MRTAWSIVRGRAAAFGPAATVGGGEADGEAAHTAAPISTTAAAAPAPAHFNRIRTSKVYRSADPAAQTRTTRHLTVAYHS